MKIEDYDYVLPERLVARRPADRREDARMMLLDPRSDAPPEDRRFADLPHLLEPGDLLVLNDTRVLRARLLGRRAPDGGKVEALLLHPEGPGRWRALVRPGKKIRVGDRLVFEPRRLEAAVEAYGEQGGGERVLAFDWRGDWWDALERYGHTPLPPYILKARKRMDHDDAPETKEDRERYQTVYASGAEPPASVAAPTAGLHFSPEILRRLDARGVERRTLRLDVGAGTFQPVQTEHVEDHPMHAEHFHLPAETAAAVDAARREGRRVVAVGTTVVRALETAALARTGRGEEAGFEPDGADGGEANWRSGRTRLMIAPGFVFQSVDALLTNFHLPRSSLLLLVSAFAGRERVLDAYARAVERGYRFYSYGDCMFLPARADG